MPPKFQLRLSKNSIRFILCTLGAALLVACQNDDTPWITASGQITVHTPSTLTQEFFTNQTEGHNITFTTDQAWTSSVSYTSATDPTTWLRITPDHGDTAGEYTIRLQLDEYTDWGKRTAVILFRCGTTVVQATITQTSTPSSTTLEITDQVEK